MSGGPACNCPEAAKSIKERAWRVLDYKCNYSKFNGSRRTPSAYSAVQCNGCGRVWRTKASYVEELS
jgi:hypothetical protein